MIIFYLIILVFSLFHLNKKREVKKRLHTQKEIIIPKPEVNRYFNKTIFLRMDIYPLNTSWKIPVFLIPHLPLEKEAA